MQPCLAMRALVLLTTAALTMAQCPALPTASYALASPFTMWTGSTNLDYGMQFQDIDGDGLAEMLHGYEAQEGQQTTCVYMNTGVAWVLSTSAQMANRSCSETLVVRDTEFPIAKHTVGQLRQAVADEFDIAVDSIIVRSKLGIKQAKPMPMADLIRVGFELTISPSPESARAHSEVFSCP